MYRYIYRLNWDTKTLQLDWADLRKIKQKPEQDIVTFVSTFNPKNPDIFHTLIHNFDILYEDGFMTQILGCQEILKSERQPQN